MIIQIGKYQKIDPEKEMHLGHQYEKNGERAIEKRCEYCGRYFCFDVKDMERWGDNVKLSFNGIWEKVHCGSEHCRQYHQRVLAHEEKMKAYQEKISLRLFRDLRRGGSL